MYERLDWPEELHGLSGSGREDPDWFSVGGDLDDFIFYEEEAPVSGR